MNQSFVERRAAQRFDFHLPVSIRTPGTEAEGTGFTQNLSARGCFLYTDFRVQSGDAVELTLVMPAEITLAENMRVRCRGKAMRVTPPLAGSKAGIAVHLEGYEFLPQSDDAASSLRTSGIESPAHEEDSVEPHSL